jgi:uncharacterized protein YkwD
MRRRSLIRMLSLLVILLSSFSVDTPAIFAQSEKAVIFLPVVFNQQPVPAPFTEPELPPDVNHPDPGSCLTPEELSLLNQLNDYRETNGLSRIPASVSLSEVAQWHVIDLMINSPNSGNDQRGYPCNSHSWSAWGHWSPVCYTADHNYASGMWSKPKEITGNTYDSAGFEISAWVSPGSISASRALEAWKGSPAHKAVILEEGDWKGRSWPAVGIGMYQKYAVVWFGSTVDPKGTITSCDE